MPAEKPTPRTQDARRSNKPIMEKRRRARINTCLNELKSLILEALRKDPSRHSKLEKADILEMTVKHLQSVQRQQMALAMASDPSVLNKFRSGFNECASEVSRYVGRIDGVDQGVRRRLVNHLGNCVTGLNVMNPLTVAAGVGGGGTGSAGGPLLAPTTWGVPHVVPQLPFSIGDLNVNNSGSAARILGGLSLIPGRLLTGDIALLLPGSHPSLMPLFSPAGGGGPPAPATPSATVTCDSDASSLQSTEKASAFTAVPRGPPGALSPISTAGSCTSGSSAFSPTMRDSTPPPPSKEPSSTNDEQQKTTTEEEDDEDGEGRAGSSTSQADCTQPSTSAADTETDRMWRPW